MSLDEQSYELVYLPNAPCVDFDAEGDAAPLDRAAVAESIVGAGTSKLRNLVFTINNPIVNGESPQQCGDAFKSYVTDKLPVRYLSFQLERGLGGTLHIQGYLELSRQVTFSKLTVVLKGAHIENRKATPAQAAAYTTKADTRVAGPWVHGELSKQGKRTDISVAVEAIERDGILGCIRQNPDTYVRFRAGLQSYAAFANRFTPRDQVRVTVYCGPAGCGKTRTCWERTPELVAIPGELQWFDNYLGDDAVLFDDFDGALSKTPLKFLLQCLDRYPLRLPVKGAFVAARWTQVYITTNFHPFDWYDWTGREQQRSALERRIDAIHLWIARDGEPEVIDRGTVRWDEYWQGPRARASVVRGPLDDYVELPDAPDYFNFML